MLRMREKMQGTPAKVIEPNFTIFMFFFLLLRGLSPLIFNSVWFPNLYCFFLYLCVFPAYNLEVRIFVLSFFLPLLKTLQNVFFSIFQFRLQTFQRFCSLYPITVATEQDVVAVMSRICIRQVLGSNFGWNTGCPQSFQANAGKIF